MSSEIFGGVLSFAEWLIGWRHDDFRTGFLGVRRVRISIQHAHHYFHGREHRTVGHDNVSVANSHLNAVIEDS